MKEPKIFQHKRYTANTPVARAVSELIEHYGGRLVLEAVADYCFQHLGLRCFAAGFGRAAERLGSAEDDSRPARSDCSAPAVNEDRLAWRLFSTPDGTGQAEVNVTLFRRD